MDRVYVVLVYVARRSTAPLDQMLLSAASLLAHSIDAQLSRMGWMHVKTRGHYAVHVSGAHEL